MHAFFAEYFTDPPGLFLDHRAVLFTGRETATEVDLPGFAAQHLFMAGNQNGFAIRVDTHLHTG